MKKRIFITATNTDVGKTYTTKLLIKEFSSRGFSVGVIKPIETGVVEYPHDGEALLESIKQYNPKLWALDIDDIVPITYALAASPYVASKNTPLDMKKIHHAIQELENVCDIILIEGAGGLYVPIDENTMMIDLIKKLGASALLVSHAKLGCINDMLLSKKALEAKGIDHEVVFNVREADEKSFDTISLPYLKQTQKKVLKLSNDIAILCNLLYNLPPKKA
ncbi:MAG: dethiobiotin synthase [Sulfurimonadaceae bacterium]|nr:dethiobiotin synthase [Sulfurimonadaceae bacterium]